MLTAAETEHHMRSPSFTCALEKYVQPDNATHVAVCSYKTHYDSDSWKVVKWKLFLILLA